MTSNPQQVPPPDLAAAEAHEARRTQGLPPGALGDLGVLTDALAALLGDNGRSDLGRPHLTVFAGDHAVASHQLTSSPPDATATIATGIATGIAPIAALADRVDISVSVVDISMAEPDSRPLGVIDAHVRAGADDITTRDAATLSDIANAIARGREEADQRITEGAGLLLGTVCGVGADVGASAIGCLLTGLEPVDAAGRDSGLDDAAWSRRVAAIRDARYRLSVGAADAATLLRVAGGPDLAALAGLIVQAALHRVPVLVDDTAGAVAAVLAHRFAPGAEHYVMWPSATANPLHVKLLGLLGCTPLMASFSLGSGGGLAALLIADLLTSATTVVESALEQHTGGSGSGGGTPGLL